MFDARAFIDRLKAEKIHFSPVGDTIEVKGDRALIDIHLNMIRRHKPALIWQLRHMAGQEVRL